MQNGIKWEFSQATKLAPKRGPAECQGGLSGLWNPPQMAASLTGRCHVVGDWRPCSPFSSCPGYDYRLHRHCGLSVAVN